MKNPKWLMMVAALSVSGLTVPAAHDDVEPGRAVTSSFNDVQRASRVLGMPVRDTAGKNAGEIEDLVVDLESGRVLFAVIDAGNNNVAVPPGIFTSVTSDRAVANVTREQIDRAPRFTRNISRSQLGQASFVSQVHKHFNQNQWWAGSNPADQGSFNNTHRLTDLRGAQVKSVSDADVGKISNMAIDLPAGRVVYVLLAPASDLNLGEALYALPPSVLTLSTKFDDTTFSADVDRQKLASGPHFGRSDWSRLTDPSFAGTVYSHYGKRAYFDPSGSLQPAGRDTGTYRPSDVISRDREGELRDRDVRDREINRGWNRGRTTTDRDTGVRSTQDAWDLDQRNRR